MIRFGIITAFATEDPSSRSLIQACSALGSVSVLHPDALEVAIGPDGVSVVSGAQALTDFDVLLLLRGFGSEGDPDVQLAVYRILEESGALLLNGVDALLAAQDKLVSSALLAMAGLPTPKVRMLQRQEAIRRALDGFERVVAKPQWGSLGEGVELLPTGSPGVELAQRRLASERSLYLQDWVDHGGSDLRVFVVGGKVEAAIERLAAAGEMRTNRSAGGSVREAELDDGLAALAVEAARVMGLEWAGVDLVVDRQGTASVLEVNGSPNWEGIREATGRDMAEAIAGHAARRALERMSREGSGTGG